MTTQAIHEDQPRPGFYKLRYDRNGKWQPVAIWLNDGKLVCRVGKDMAEPERVWTWCAGNKVTPAAAKFAFDHGHFPDEPPPAGHNAPPSDDPFEALKAELQTKQDQAVVWINARPEIKSQADCDYARNAQAELLALVKRADTMFTTEKAPLLAATRACDEKYRFRTIASELAARLRKAFERFMVAEEDRRKAEAAANLRAEQKRIAAERARIEAEQAQRMQDDPVAALTEAPPEMPELPLEAEPVKIQAGGGVGRKAGLKTVWVPTVNDYLAAAGHFIQHPDLKAAIDKLVNHAVKDSKGTLVIPGVSIKEGRAAA